MQLPPLPFPARPVFLLVLADAAAVCLDEFLRGVCFARATDSFARPVGPAERATALAWTSPFLVSRASASAEPGWRLQPLPKECGLAGRAGPSLPCKPSCLPLPTPIPGPEGSGGDVLCKGPGNDVAPLLAKS